MTIHRGGANQQNECRKHKLLTFSLSCAGRGSSSHRLWSACHFWIPLCLWQQRQALNWVSCPTGWKRMPSFPSLMTEGFESLMVWIWTGPASLLFFLLKSCVSVASSLALSGLYLFCPHPHPHPILLLFHSHLWKFGFCHLSLLCLDDFCLLSDLK